MRFSAALLLVLGGCGPCAALVCTGETPCWRSDFTCDDDTNVALIIPVHTISSAERDTTTTVRFYLTSGDRIRLKMAFPYGPLVYIGVEDNGTFSDRGEVDTSPGHVHIFLDGTLERGRRITVTDLSSRSFSGPHTWNEWPGFDSSSTAASSATFPPSR